MKEETITTSVCKVMHKGTHYNIVKVEEKVFAWRNGRGYYVGCQERNYQAVRSALRRLIKRGLVHRPSKGVYMRIL